MKSIVTKLWLASVVCLATGTGLFAQTNKKVSGVESQYVISAKAGGINFVSGRVTVAGKDAKNLMVGQSGAARAGEKIITGSDGKAEILLNPGSFVRLGENSEFEFVETGLDDLKVKLTAGGAIFEVIASDDFKITVDTPKSTFYLIKSGVYRVDAMADGTARIQVWRGKAQLGNTTAVKGGRAATIVDGQTIVGKFDRDDKTELEVWSKERAKELAKINAKLQNRAMNSALISSFSQRGWSIYDSFGLWVRDPLTRSYCFLPFGYGWSSPYGYGFQRDIWSYQLPQAIFYNPQYQNNPNAAIPGQTGRPPFQTVQPNPSQANPSQPDSSGVTAPVRTRQPRPSMPDSDVQVPSRGRGGRPTAAPIDQ